MLIPTIIMATLACVLLWIGYMGGEGQHIAGTKRGFALMIKVLPLLVFAFIVAGMVEELLPHQTVRQWVGSESGLRGILIGSVAGALSPGGPFVSLPIALGLLRAGAGVGTMVAYLTGWSLWAVARLPMEVGILGWKLTLIRFASVLVFPPIAGVLAQLFFGGVNLLEGLE